MQCQGCGQDTVRSATVKALHGISQYLFGSIDFVGAARVVCEEHAQAAGCMLAASSWPQPEFLQISTAGMIGVPIHQTGGSFHDVSSLLSFDRQACLNQCDTEWTINTSYVRRSL
jgi:hypothetical protein